MLGLWLATAALASSPELHHYLHSDANQIGHECLISVVSKGHLAAPAGAAALVPLLIGGMRAAWLVFRLPDSIDHRLSPSRAPPLGYFTCGW